MTLPRKLTAYLTLIFLVTLSACSTSAPPVELETAASLSTLYDNQLQSSLSNWSWNTSVNFGATRSGSDKAIQADFRGPWAGLSLKLPNAVGLSGYKGISFDIRNPGQRITVFVHDRVSNPAKREKVIEASDSWRNVFLSWDELGSPATLERLNFHEKAGRGGGQLFIDNLRLVADSGNSSAPSNASATGSSSGAIYSNALQRGVANWSWNTSVDFGSSRSGSDRAIQASYRGSWAALSLKLPSTVSTSGTTGIAFDIRNPGQRVGISTRSTPGGQSGAKKAIEASDGWRSYTVSWSELGNPSQVAQINFQEYAGRGGGTVYVDNIRFVSGSGNAAPAPAPAPEPAPAPSAPSESAPRNSSNAVMYSSFNNNPLGTYKQGGLDVMRGCGRDGSNCLRATYAPTSYGSKRFHYTENLPPAREYTLNYDLRLSDNWQFKRGGKLPGLSATNYVSGCQASQANGWTARIMWRDSGRMVQYLYHQDRTGPCGEDVAANGITLQPGRWYDVSLYVKVNSSAGARDGEIRMYLDGREVARRTGLRLRGVSGNSGLIERFLFSSFYGGNDSSWAPSTTTYAYFDNFAIYPGLNVQR